MDYINTGKEKVFYTREQVEYVACPLCGKGKYQKIYTEKKTLGIVKCLECRLIYVNPRVRQSHEVYRLDVDKYFREAQLIFEGKASHHRDPNYIQDLKLIQKYKPYGNFLDIGTGMGFFLRLARNQDWNLYGVEQSPSLSEIARRYFDLNVKTSFFEDAVFESNFFEIITLIDVFEHSTNPALMLDKIHRILKADGILYIKIPNGLFNLLKLYMTRLIAKSEDYDLFDAHEHLVHYTHVTIRKMLEKCKFKIINTFIGKPIQFPTWHKYVGYYYQYPIPWFCDPKSQSARNIFYLLSLVEFRLKAKRASWLAPNIIVIAIKK